MTVQTYSRAPPASASGSLHHMQGHWQVTRFLSKTMGWLFTLMYINCFAFLVECALIAKACRDLEKDAQKKAEKALLREKQKMQKEIDALWKGKQKANDEKHLADEAHLVVENAKSIADKEKN